MNIPEAYSQLCIKAANAGWWVEISVGEEQVYIPHPGDRWKQWRKLTNLRVENKITKVRLIQPIRNGLGDAAERLLAQMEPLCR